ncbi:hypothetical protein PVAND_005184 [Polypedilum vanderplanki]|uniref:Knr4/Smi1-like domain-containing protein n=1 Tax=Polypedilum vanderplanki TaxID=319348 RepID=A0A9J6C1B0_POLVA|nr:hypothetical protein PVAND_005184 [Polypedilum vanderplanki]
MSASASDDAFYENLTLGLIKVLNQIQRINSINYDKRNPTERTSISAWETRHNVSLPSDMKAFYLCTDGFCLFWSYEYTATDNKRVGKIHIPHLIQITLIRENLESIMNANQNIPKTPISAQHNDAIPQLHLTPKSKIFELSTILDLAKVVMIYEVPETNVMRIYLLELESLKLQFLADTFSEYLRMAIAHLGLPYWELCFSSCSLPSWTQQLFLLLAPHLLENNEPRRNVKNFHNGNDENPPFNTLDPSVFRSKPRSSKAPKHK